MFGILIVNMISYNHFKFVIRVKPSPFSAEFHDMILDVRSDKYITALHLLNKHFNILNSVCVQQFEVIDKYEWLEKEQLKSPF